ncbi:ORF V: Enzymatic polyprotein [Labeo rohita]|uniref:ribonuclease H n=1 Tax=Labeo rohita TaxID=84645 RepID=A0ABQ8LW78_LABRO|nr:ORF V: Enzymatic polyprotein [Labeo rohita]
MEVYIPCIDYRQLNSQIIQQPYGLHYTHRVYECQVMPYGLSISPSVFQTFMNEVFRELLHRFVMVYIDDILIYSWNQADHRQHVQQVQQCEYLIDWEEYGPEERLWIAQEDVFDLTLLLKFHRRNPDRPSPHSRGRPLCHVRALGAAPGGGGNVRHSPQPPPPSMSPVAPPTRSQSPEF